MVSYCSHCSDLDGYGELSIEVMHGGRGIPLSVVRPHRMDITPDMALNMCRSLHLTVNYLLKSEQRGFGD